MATISIDNRFMASCYLLHQYVSLYAILRKLVTKRAGPLYIILILHRTDLSISPIKTYKQIGVKYL